MNVRLTTWFKLVHCCTSSPGAKKWLVVARKVSGLDVTIILYVSVASQAHGLMVGHLGSGLWAPPSDTVMTDQIKM